MKKNGFKAGKIYKVTLQNGEVLIVKLKGGDSAKLQVKNGSDIDVESLGIVYSIEEIGDDYASWGI